MEKHTLIALISLWFISTTALILSIIGVSNNWHDCWFERWRMMPMMGRENMMQWQKWWMNKQYMRLPGSGTIPTEQAIAE
jgi:hypothetical protein